MLITQRNGIAYVVSGRGIRRMRVISTGGNAGVRVGQVFEVSDQAFHVRMDAGFYRRG